MPCMRRALQLRARLPTPALRGIADFQIKERRTVPPVPVVDQGSPLEDPRIDIQAIAANLPGIVQNAVLRKATLRGLDAVTSLYAERRELDEDISAINAKRKVAQRHINDRTLKPDEKQSAIDQARALRSDVFRLAKMRESVQERLLAAVMPIPNSTHPSVPIGPESSAREIFSHRSNLLRPSIYRDHTRIAATLGLLDLENAAVVTGSSWYYLMAEAASLEIALVNYALSVATKKGWKMVMTPDVVKADVANRCGFQPRDGEANQIYPIQMGPRDQEQLVLAGTAEIPLAGLFAMRTLKPADLPAKLVGVGHAFRAEAGARGADTRGLYRVHQFTKVELFAVTQGWESEAMMEEMLALQVEIITGLGIPFRVLDMPSEELGAAAYRKYDIEAWMPGRGRWGEISSLSNCTDYQARRLLIQFRTKDGRPSSTDTESSTPASTETSSSDSGSQDADGESDEGDDPRPFSYKTASPSATGRTTGRPIFAHTLNGTAAAIPRLIIALLENGAILDRETTVGLCLPVTLKPFWVGPHDRIEWIKPSEVEESRPVEEPSKVEEPSEVEEPQPKAD